MRWRWTLSHVLAVIAMLIMLGALAQLFMSDSPLRDVRFLYLRDAGVPLLLGAGWLAMAQRRIDWADRPEKLRKLKYAKPLLVLGIGLMTAVLVFAPTS